jgi:hypothetical protein
MTPKTPRFLGALLTLSLLAIPALAAPPLLQPLLEKGARETAPGMKTRGQAVRLNRQAMRDMRRGGELEVSLPSGRSHAIVIDMVQDHGGDIQSWVGHVKDRGTRNRVVITSGPDGSFGVISTPEGDFRLVPGEGHDWLVDMVAEQEHIPLPRPRNDARVVPEDAKGKRIDAAPASLGEYEAAAELVQAVPGENTPAIMLATPSPMAVIDLLVVYTNGYRSAFASEAAMLTRLNNLVARANTTYADSEIAIQLRLAGTQPTTYGDATDDDEALTAISPNCTVNSCGAAFNAAVFGNIETVRNTVGADMVALLRGGGSNFGSGIAWIGGSSPNAAYMYSVTTGCTTACDSVFIHELGHNMGNQHDRPTAFWQSNGATPGGGSTPNSFGYVFCNSGAYTCNPFVANGCGGSHPECSPDHANNFGDIMAYFHATTEKVYKFSNPNVMCAASIGDGTPRPCGTTTENAAAGMNAVRLAISALRAGTTPSLTSTTTVVTSSVNPSTAAQSVTFTATVTGAGGTPTGTVSFRADGTTISGCSAVALSGGSATCATSALASGARAITAAYSGNATFAASTSSALTQTVNPMATTIAVTTSGSPSIFGSGVSFTATLGGGTGSPTGSVDFRANGVSIAGCGAVPVSSRSASCVTGALAQGSHTITAVYSGDALFGASTSAGITQNVIGQVPAAKRVPRIGDFNGDGRGDLLWYLADGRVVQWLMDGTGVTAASTLRPATSGWYADQLGRFDAGATTDLVFGNTDGTFELDMAATVSGLRAAFSGWATQAIGDFNGDGLADLVWRHSDGRVEVRLMNGSATTATGSLQGAGSTFQVSHVGDFNGDGRSDILWRGADGRVIVWLMNGTTYQQSLTLQAGGAGFNVVQVADFNADGRSDIVFEHSDGHTELWLMNGVSMTSSATLQAVGSAWRVTATGDFNNDGRADILWRNVTYGNVVMWLMNGTSYIGARTLRTSNAEWTVGVVGDTNADGRADIVWLNTNGSAAIWLMDGVNMTAEAAVTPSANPPLSTPPAPPAASATALGTSLTPSTAGQSVTFTATVSGTGGPPTGSVDFRDGGVSIAGCGSVALVAGSATCTTGSLGAATHSITAVYSGGPGFNTSTSSALSQVVNRANTTTTVSGPAASGSGSVATFTAAIGGGFGPTGTVAFLANGVGIPGCASVAVSGASASCAANGLAVATHSITATYSGDANNNGSASAGFTHTVSAAPPPPPPPVGAFRATQDFDGDGDQDLLWHHTDGRVVQWLMSGATAATITTLRNAGAGWTATHVADFDADGRADIVWRHTDGRVELWLMNGAAMTSSALLQAAGSGWSVQRLGDFNGDGRADVIWKHTDGRVEITLYSGAAVLGTRTMQAAGTVFNVSHAADFNADGKSDLLWRAPDGRVIVWLMDGVNFTSSRTLQSVGGTGTVAHAVDFNDDAKADIVWEYSDGSTVLWRMDGVVYTSSQALQAAGSAWRVAHVGDFNADSFADVLWRNVTYGNTVAWLMNGTTYTASRTLRGASTGWTATHAAPFDAGAGSDILWRHTDGSVQLWLMNGVNSLSETALMPAGGWTVRP